MRVIAHAPILRLGGGVCLTSASHLLGLALLIVGLGGVPLLLGDLDFVLLFLGVVGGLSGAFSSTSCPLLAPA